MDNLHQNKPMIRAITEYDLPFLKAVVASNDLFPPELLDEMTRHYLITPSSTEIWLTKIIDSTPVAVAYCAPERMTEGTYNLYLIAVHHDHQGKGIGTEIMLYLEEALKKWDVRILIVETSGLASFELTRKFYDQLGYHREALIREFYQRGEDKIVFWKKLTGE